MKEQDFTTTCDECGKECTLAQIHQANVGDKKLCTQCDAILNMPPQYAEILKDSNILERIDNEFDKKIEGEKEARKTIFMIFNMRNVENLNKATDNLMVNDEGGTGKDYVVDNVFKILPDEEKIKKVRITPKVLAYMNDLKQAPNGWIKKALYLEDVPNGVLNDDAFKVMCSADPSGITKTSIIINQKIHNIDIKGKASIIITIATANPKQEMLRRFPILNLTSTRAQTRAVLKKQARFAIDGKSAEYDRNIKTALWALKRIKVKIPEWAANLSEIFPDGNIIIRTHFTRFLDYIKSSCALHQYQRNKDDTGYYMATEQDYEIARKMLTQTTSNQLMISHTKEQKEILERFSQMEDRAYRFKDIEEIMQDICSYTDKWLRNQLNKLTKDGFLKRGQEKDDTSIKPYVTYRYNNIVRLKLPSFSELKKCANSAHRSNSSHSSNSSNKRDKASPSNMNNMNVVNSEFDSQKNIAINEFKEKTGYTDADIEEYKASGELAETKHGYITIL